MTKIIGIQSQYGWSTVSKDKFREIACFFSALWGDFWVGFIQGLFHALPIVVLVTVIQNQFPLMLSSKSASFSTSSFLLPLWRSLYRELWNKNWFFQKHPEQLRKPGTCSPLFFSPANLAPCSAAVGEGQN